MLIDETKLNYDTFGIYLFGYLNIRKHFTCLRMLFLPKEASGETVKAICSRAYSRYRTAFIGIVFNFRHSHSAILPSPILSVLCPCTSGIVYAVGN